MSIEADTAISGVIVDTFKVPATIEQTVTVANRVSKSAFACHWALAAMVRANVRKQQGKRTSMESHGSLSISEFSRLGIIGLRDINTIRRYYDAWDDTGLPDPVPGETIQMPAIEFPGIKQNTANPAVSSGRGGSSSQKTCMPVDDDDEDEDETFVCECGETFSPPSPPVWHCQGCDHHWSRELDTDCRNCHRYEFVNGDVRLIQFDDDDDDEEESARPVVSRNTGDNEWYTPRQYAEAATSAMGGIDLDPASSDVANTVIGAASFYTRDDDGLGLPWAGRVWMNPPYAQPLITDFCARLVKQYTAGDVSEACVLVNNATETGWFQDLAAVAGAICFPRGRVKFWHPEKEATPLQGQAVIYLGKNPGAFRGGFKSFGIVVML